MKKAIKRILWGVLLLVLLAMGGGLHAIWPFLTYPVEEIKVQRKTPRLSEPNDQLLAGVGVRDITTPIGIPKMGYSAWARDADGFRNRLKARAFYLKPPGGEPLLVLQADLPASSLVLQRKVAERVAERTDVAVHNLSLHVTHTHSGPGQYFSSDFYNAFGSNRPGFDPDVFGFLVQQLSEAVVEAYEQRRPAKLAIGQTELYGVTRNRAMGAYVRNENVSDKQQTEAAALRAVNPRITLVRLDGLTEQGDYRPLGAFSTFAIHGTAIPPFTHPYHGDVWAFFERQLEDHIRHHYQPPWPVAHGPFEANHGDNNPNYRLGLRGDIETRRIGLQLAQQAWQLFQSLDDQLTDQVTITSAQRELDVSNLAAEDRGLLCERAIAGTAVVGAAKDDEVFPISYLPPFQRGWPDDGAGDCHGAKRWMLSRLQAWGLAPWRYPHRISISSFRINELILVGLPFEVTFEAGNRMADAVQQAVSQYGNGIRQVVISSHTNGFFGYSTTPEEYSAQWYEGGHTIYGPNTTPFLARESRELVAMMLQQPGYADLPEQWQFNLASARYFPESVTPSGKRVQLQPAVFVAAARNQEPYWEWQVLDVNPGQLQLHQPLLAVEVSDDGEHFSTLLDDQGLDLQVIHNGASDAGMSRYTLRWYNPEIAVPGRWFRFRLEPRINQALFHSSPFR
ncbi:MAG: neutral/alkaline non-lysosomal ceramidase N-terminal domain-containing protein [Pseudomonadota bacterium]|nr:neutral/alkaline non-lysosomal ceramidase N-terminal domain-containing protein [Pseudomonadota bacterium]